MSHPDSSSFDPLRAAAMLASSLVLLGFSPTASAQSYSIHGVGSISNSFTDNVRNEPDETIDPLDPDAPPNTPSTAFFTQVQPSLLFTYESPRSVHVTSLGIDYAVYYLVEDASDEPPEPLSGTFRHASLFRTSRATELGIGADAGFGAVTAAIADAAEGVAGGTGDGGSTFLSVSASQSFRWELSRDWSIRQGASATQIGTTARDAAGAVANETTGRNFSFDLGVNRVWARTALGINDTVSYINLTQSGNELDSLQLSNNFGVSLTRDLTPRLSGSLQAGVATLSTLQAQEEAGEGTSVIPSGSLTLNYVRLLGTVPGSIGLSVNQSIQPNLFLAVTTRSTGATLLGSIPLPWVREGPVFKIQIAGGLSRINSEVIDEAATVAPKFHVTSANIGVVYTPTESWSVSLRYQHVAQVGDVDADMIDSAAPLPPDFTSNTVFLQLGGRFPSRVAARMPDRRALRVDRANEEPVGDEGQSVGGANQRNNSQ